MALNRNGGFGRSAFASGSALVAVLALGGCFEDHFMESGADDPAAGSTSSMAAESTGNGPGGTTGSEPVDGSTSAIGGTTGEPGSEGSSSGSTSEGDESSSSTGVAQDETTGEVVLGVNDLVPGDLVITEVMWNPSCSADTCEWIEILNATTSPVNLLDLYVQDIDLDAVNQGRVTVDLVVGPGELAVIARGVSFWPYDFVPGAIYGPNPGLNNGTPDAVVLRNDSGVLDETASFWLDQEEGVAWSLSGDLLDVVSNDSAVSWCDATALLPTVSTTELGSPGGLNEGCAG
jgi:Lamin Tail Domain